jgi:hypothetical protein
MRRVAVIVVVVGALLAGCGGSDNGPQLSQKGRHDLVDRVAAVRASLGGYAPDQARSHLAVLREQVADLKSRNRISDDQASEILSAAAAVEADLGLAPTTTTTTTTLPVAKPGKGHDKEKGKH